MHRTTVELSALGFEALVTSLVALAYTWLWARQHRAFFASWAAAWSLHALRIGCISVFLVVRDDIWLFLHQALSGLAAMFLLIAALQFSRGTRWRWSWLAYGLIPIVLAGVLIYGVRSPMVAGITAVSLLSAVTLWTGVVFWRRREGGGWSRALAVTFFLWGIHHLDYPLLRPLGEGVLYGVFADVTLIVAVTMLTMFLVLREGRRALEVRTQQMEQLTRLLLHAQEDERRRIARELHDEAGQVLTAVKIELDMEGRAEASALVGRALAQVRDLSNLIRPSVLDDLGLIPALRAMADDFARRAGIEVHVDVDERAGQIDPGVQVAIYRVVQEALTNVARHAGAKRAVVRLARADGRIRLSITDDGRGISGELRPHLGVLGMRERVADLGGVLDIGRAEEGGVRVSVELPEQGSRGPGAAPGRARAEEPGSLFGASDASPAAGAP